MRLGRSSQLRIRIQDSLQQKLLFCWVRKSWTEAASAEARSAADDGWRLQLNFSAAQWNDQKMNFINDRKSRPPVVTWYDQNLCCLSGEFAEKASLQKFCNLIFECFCENLTEILPNRVICDLQNQRNNSSFPECYWTSEIFWVPVNFCVRHLRPAFSSTGDYPGAAARSLSTILMIIS